MPDLRTMTQVVLDEVAAERLKQDQKWGDQRDHDDGMWALILGEEFGEACQASLEKPFLGTGDGPTRDELIQVAAVAVCWIESIDRR